MSRYDFPVVDSAASAPDNVGDSRVAADRPLSIVATATWLRMFAVGHPGKPLLTALPTIT